MAVRSHLAFPAPLGCPQSLGSCCLPSLPSVSRLGCVSRPAWGCSLSGRLCFLSLSPGPVATVHHCWADLSAWTVETATDVGPWDGPQKARLWFPGHADRKRSRWQTLGVSEQDLLGGGLQTQWGPRLAAEMSVTGLRATPEGALWQAQAWSPAPGEGGPQSLSCGSEAPKGPGRGGDCVGASPHTLCFPLCALCVSGLCPGLHK